MQERYLGDVHDFIKYAFIRHLARTTGLRLGLNWYLTDPKLVDKPSNQDGNIRFHLDQEDWGAWDPDLMSKLQPFSEPRGRNFRRFYKSEVLPPSTVYVDALVSKESRNEWHEAALSKLKPVQHVFLDPDNGLEVKSATKKTRPKYALYSEIADYIANGIAVTSIQFARQCDPVKRAQDVQSRVVAATQSSESLPVLRCRAAPNFLLITVTPDGFDNALNKAIRSFAASAPPMDKNGARVMVLE